MAVITAKLNRSRDLGAERAEAEAVTRAAYTSPEAVALGDCSCCGMEFYRTADGDCTYCREGHDCCRN